MNSQGQNPFETIESAQDFLRLLSTAISDAKLDLESDVRRMGSSELSRRKDTIQIAGYSLEKLRRPCEAEPPNTERSANAASSFV